MHLCDNKLCINPDHFGQGSNIDNMKDMVDKGKQGNQKAYRRLTEDEKFDMVVNPDNLTVYQLMEKHKTHRTTIQKLRQRTRESVELNVKV